MHKISCYATDLGLLKGVDKVGKQIAHALARSGFGDELLEAVKRRETHSLHNFLPGWRQRMNAELRENRKGFLSRCRPGLTIPDTFPKLELLDKYVEPVLRTGGACIRGNGEMNLPKIAEFCEKYFEWGTRTIILKRFRSFMWDACLTRVLRRAALEQDRKEIDARLSSGISDTFISGTVRPDVTDAVGTSISLITKHLNPTALDRRSEAFVTRGNTVSANDPRSFVLDICFERRHISTDNLLEYRIKLDPTALVQLTNNGIKGTRPDVLRHGVEKDNWSDDELNDVESSPVKGKGKTPEKPNDPIRLWCPAGMLERIDPGIVRKYEQAAQERTARKERQKLLRGMTPSNGRRNSKRKEMCSDDDSDTSVTSNSPLSYQRKRRGTIGQAPKLIPQRPARFEPVMNAVEMASPSASQTCLVQKPHRLAKLRPVPEEELHSETQGINSPDTSFHRATRQANFLFRMNDPCDPDLIEREDLRPEPIYSNNDECSFHGNLTDESMNTRRYGLEDDEFDFSDDALDKSHQRRFFEKARSSISSKTERLTPGPSKSVSKHDARVLSAQQTESARRLAKVKLSDEFAPAPYSIPRSRKSTALSKRTSEKQHSWPFTSFPSLLDDQETDLPLFLPSESPEACKSTFAINTKPRTVVSEAIIDLDSSDEETYPVSSQASFNDSANPWSQESSQDSLQSRLSGTTLAPSSSQTDIPDIGDFDFSW